MGILGLAAAASYSSLSTANLLTTVPGPFSIALRMPVGTGLGREARALRATARKA